MACATRLTRMGDATKPIVSVRDLAVEFHQHTGTVRALESVNLDLYPGRVLGVVGESGCGKSVTARAMLRILDRNGSITAGRVTWDPGTPEEQDLTALPSEGSQIRAVRGGRIGLIFQEAMAWLSMQYRSEERRVGKECRSRW